jgi:hypothetical protein
MHGYRRLRRRKSGKLRRRFLEGCNDGKAKKDSEGLAWASCDAISSKECHLSATPQAAVFERPRKSKVLHGGTAAHVTVRANVETAKPSEAVLSPRAAAFTDTSR